MAKVKVEEVLIKEERFREDYGDVEELAVSIQRYGLLHPIVVQKDEDGKVYLVAGERRLRAHKLLGLKEIEVRYVNELNELERREVEIEENLKRKNFTWQEEVKAKKEIDRIKREMYGSAIKGHGGGWSIRDTADSLGDSIGTVSRDLKLARALEEFPELAKEKNKEAAFRKYKKLQEKKIVEVLADKVEVKVGKDWIVNGDSAVEMKKLPSNSADLVLTDPPFAIALDKGGLKSDDEMQSVLNTIGLVVKECYRVLKEGRHMYIFFAIQHYNYVLKLLQDTGFNVNPVPCIWYKTGGAGAGGSEYAYASNYETFFLAMKGRRPLNKLGESNVFVEPRVAPQRKVHPTEKPTPLLRKLIEQSTQPGELVIDPFAGSGSTLVAAWECKRKAWGCEIDKEYYGQVLLKLEKLQSL